jgi:hypothetical protein
VSQDQTTWLEYRLSPLLLLLQPLSACSSFVSHYMRLIAVMLYGRRPFFTN